MSPSQRALRIGFSAASLVLLVLTVIASPGPVWVAIPVLALLTVFAALRTHTHLVTLVVLGHALHWVIAVPVPTTWARWALLLVASLLGLVVHLTAALTATLPGQAPVPTVTLRRWGLRGATVAVLSTPVWLVAAVAGQADLPGQLPLSYAAVAGLALLTLGLWLLSREARPPA
jgi:hypothetical protein